MSVCWDLGRIFFFPGKEKLSEKYKQEPKLSFVIKAIYTMAYGLHDMVQDVCGRGGRKVAGLCPDLFPFNGSLFKVSGYHDVNLLILRFQTWKSGLRKYSWDAFLLTGMLVAFTSHIFDMSREEQKI